MAAQLPGRLAGEFDKLNLGIVAHAEGITIEVELTLEEDIQKGQVVMLRFKRSKTRWQKAEVQT
jgi:hypothetical protein